MLVYRATPFERLITNYSEPRLYSFFQILPRKISIFPAFHNVFSVFLRKTAGFSVFWLDVFFRFGGVDGSVSPSSSSDGDGNDLPDVEEIYDLSTEDLASLEEK